MDPKELREQAVREAKCNLILDAALGVFSEKGYWETRLEDIAASAGFSKASLYNYYPDKEAIFLSLGVREYTRVFANVEQSINPSAGFETNLRAALTTIFDHFGRFFSFMVTTTDFQMTRLLQMDGHRELAGRFHGELRRMGDIYVRLLAAGRAAGEVTTKLDDETVARYIGALARGMLVEWKLVRRMGDTRAAAESIVRFVMDGIG